jgi:hypothetical protein
MDDAVERARAVMAAASPGPWELREHEGAAAVACANGWAMEDGNPNPEVPDKRAAVLAVNVLPALLDVLEACVRPAGPADAHRRCMLCDVTARELRHEPGCPVDAAEARLREALR